MQVPPEFIKLRTNAMYKSEESHHTVAFMMMMTHYTLKLSRLQHNTCASQRCEGREGIATQAFGKLCNRREHLA